MAFRRELVVSLLATVVFAASCAPVESDDSKAVQAAFHAYKESILAQDGPAAVQFLPQSIFEFYEGVRQKALHAPPEEVHGMALTTRISVMRVRMQIAPEQLEGMTGKGLCELAIDKGWISRESVSELDVDVPHISGDRATCAAVKTGKKMPITFQFLKENGAWKVDLAAIMADADGALKIVREKQGMDEETFFGVMMERVMGRPLTSQDYDPPRPEGK